MKTLYAEWLAWNTHLDHKMGPLQDHSIVYAPDPFLVGQNESQSDIMGNAFLHKRLWSKAPNGLPVVLLKAPRGVKEKLASHLHYGYTIDKAGVDVGLVEAFNQADPTKRLRKFIDEVGGEAWIVGKHCAIWHPAATVEVVEKVHRPVIVVEADSYEEAVARLPVHAAPPAPPIVLLRASRQVADELASMGFHRGYWLSNQDGVDNGLRDMFASKEGEALVEGLRAWIGLVGAEAKKIRNGVLTVWHSDATLDLLRLATDQRVIEITGATAEECLRQL